MNDYESRVKDVLAAYDSAYRQHWRTMVSERNAMEQLKKACAPEQRRLNKRLKRIINDGSPYELVEARVYPIIGHGNPCEVSLGIEVHLNYWKPRIQYDVKLHVMWKNIDVLLDEVRRLTGANT